MKNSGQIVSYKRFVIKYIHFLSILAIGMISYCTHSYTPQIILRSEWKALAPKQGGIEQVPKKITIHHSGELYNGKPEAKEVLRNIQKFHQVEKGWIDIAYHYLLDLDGKIYEGRDVNKVGDTATNYDPTNHISICVVGNYEIQEPSKKQLVSLEKLTCWLSRKYNISSDNISAHRDYANTLCPGKNLYFYMENLKKPCD